MNEPNAVDQCYSGRKKACIHCGRLTAIGLMHELNSDGHEKLNSQALQMGTVGIGIYAKKDKYSSSFLVI